MLLEHGHDVFPVSPKGDDVLGQTGHTSLADLERDIDTLTVYVNPTRLAPLVDEILSLGPKRVILNPGTESDDVEASLSKAGIDVLRACTLVLLSTGQFES